MSFIYNAIASVHDYLAGSSAKVPIYYNGVGCRPDHYHTEAQFRNALRTLDDLEGYEPYPGDLDTDDLEELLEWSGAGYNTIE